MQFRTLNLALVPAVAIGMAACSSSNPNQQMDNGFIAYVDDDTHEFSNTGSAGFKYTLDEGELKISWNKGPLKNTTRTFTLVDSNPPIYDYELQDDEEAGYIVSLANADASFALGEVQQEGDTKRAFGVAHFGTKPTNVPTSGSLTYTGVAVGQVWEGQISDTYIGNALVGVNFANGEVMGGMENLQSVNHGEIPMIGFLGTLDPGKTTYTATDIVWNSAPASGTVLGGLYGPGATSTAGAFDITSGDSRTMGGFVAQTP